MRGGGARHQPVPVESWQRHTAGIAELRSAGITTIEHAVLRASVSSFVLSAEVNAPKTNRGQFARSVSLNFTRNVWILTCRRDLQFHLRTKRSYPNGESGANGFVRLVLSNEGTGALLREGRSPLLILSTVSSKSSAPRLMSFRSSPATSLKDSASLQVRVSAI